VNPIVVKEVRQAVRSKFVSGMLLIFLFLLLSASVVVLLTTAAKTSFETSYPFSAGATLFSVLSGLLYTVCILFVPAYTGIRLSAERWSPDMDLFYITTVTPASIVRGKLLTGIIITLLIYSIAMPFVAFTYPMRGIDLPSAFTILAANFGIVIVIIQAVILIALIPAGKVFRILLALVCIPVVITFLRGIFAFSEEMIMTGVGSRMFSGHFWEIAAFVGAFAFSVFWVLHILSIALIMPKSMNRALLLRGWITLIWALWGVAFVISISLKSIDAEYIIAWLGGTIILLMAALLVIISERDTLSARVRRTIPRSLLRIPAFLLYNGTAGGILWVLLLLLVTVLITLAGVRSTYEEGFQFLLALFFYVYSYVLTAHLLWMMLLKKYIRKSLIYLIVLFAILFGSLLPVVVDVVVNRSPDSIFGAWRVFNIFALFHDADRSRMTESHLFAASIWALGITMMHLPWFIKCYAQFKRPIHKDG
jgi:hypothetical protein